MTITSKFDLVQFNLVRITRGLRLRADYEQEGWKWIPDEKGYEDVDDCTLVSPPQPDDDPWYRGVYHEFDHAGWFVTLGFMGETTTNFYAPPSSPVSGTQNTVQEYGDWDAIAGDVPKVLAEAQRRMDEGNANIQTYETWEPIHGLSIICVFRFTQEANYDFQNGGYDYEDYTELIGFLDTKRLDQILLPVKESHA